METHKKEADRLTGMVMDVDPASLGIGSYELVDGRRELFVFNIPSLGTVLPAWHRREDMVVIYRFVHPDHEVGRMLFLPVASGDMMISFAARHGLTIVVNPRVIEDGKLIYGRIAWN